MVEERERSQVAAERDRIADERDRIADQRESIVPAEDGLLDVAQVDRWAQDAAGRGMPPNGATTPVRRATGPCHSARPPRPMQV